MVSRAAGHARLSIAVLVGLLMLLMAALPAAAQSGGGSGASDTGGSSGGSGAAAESLPPGAVSASAEKLQDLVDTLQDDQQRQDFVGKLNALIEAKQADSGQGGADAGNGASKAGPDGLGAQLLRAITERLDQAGSALAGMVDTVKQVPAIALELWSEVQNDQQRQLWTATAINLLLILGAAIVVERLAHWSLRIPRRRIEARANDNVLVQVLFLIARTLLDAVPIALFAAAAFGTMTVVQPREVAQVIVVALINASVLSRVVALLGRAILAPDAGGLRLPKLTDETAHYLFIWLRRVARTAIYGYVASEALGLLGLSTAAVVTVQKLIGFAIALMVIVFVLQNRQPVARWLRGPADEYASIRGLRTRLAELWHVLGVVYVLVVYGVWALEVPGGFVFLARATLVTIAVLIAARLINLGLDKLINRGFQLSDDIRRRYPGLEARANRYLPTVKRILRALVTLVAALMILQVWGAGALDWLTSSVGRDLLGTVITVAMILGLTFAFWEIVSATIERVLTRSSQRDTAKRSQRLATLLPLLRNALRILLIVVVSLIVLSEIGVDIGPLLAGAGVIGLAIGFGAQTLVKDVITGVFILLEDSLAIGDWVDLGGHGGEVESMTIRTITLRDLHGHIHVVPFSDVTSILNMARDYGYAVIDIGVAYREDTDAVIQLLQEVAEDLKNDSDWGPKIIGELEVFGVNNLGDSSVEIRVRLKTKTLAHWGMRREFLRRAKQKFDERGVEIPYPHRTLYFGQDRQGEAPPARVALQRPPRGGEGELETSAPSQTSSTTPTDDPDAE
ncbi:mechanosensitive ion channel family protein [Rhodovibrio salinarum]|nr:mechanosensitive ion channel domain-containing protein [Rhodovibrio salinarum]